MPKAPPTSYRLEESDLALIRAIAQAKRWSQTTVISEAVRRLAKSEGVTLWKSDTNAQKPYNSVLKDGGT